jgi:hypothetical protein
MKNDILKKRLIGVLAIIIPVILTFIITRSITYTEICIGIVVLLFGLAVKFFDKYMALSEKHSKYDFLFFLGLGILILYLSIK